MEKNSDTTGETPKHLDFITSICLFLLSVYIIADSLKMIKTVGGPVYSSPGLLPIIIGSMLMLCTVVLFIKSMKSVGFMGNLRALSEWFRPFIKDTDTRAMLSGIAIIAVYSFVLVPRLPFLLSSIIFMVFLMKVINAGSYLKISLISVSVSASLYILFEIIFKVPLP
ncbi:tripartite tricarboxylate transporter TctB family protein [Paenibacillus sp. N3.4]|uniref:tripartite tricarboxylate transporter TctB family protein n=1 Tax=Paenibacillus sp. N3.4 TaxID=2603222 RepID=UPI0011CC9C24|nr:tripartite tricarboxylate transporter TctB family protein [Paenibacillus sp. N3.4]TXK84992.1 tripartite tricarboxylate transporter TctB family protein [Paenibacillus sp. N3.4]